MTDGARNAMLGYLYQFSLTASLRAYSPDETVPGQGWPTLVGRVAAGTLTNEIFNQDAAVLSREVDENVCAAVQVKHSGDTAEPINLQTFTELLFGFDRSRKLAEAEGVYIDEYYVITNRQPNESTAKLWQSRSSAELKNQLESRKKLP